MLSIRDVVVDPELESLLRPLNEDESNKLGESILRGWSDESIKVWLGHNLLIDGHNRFKKWQTLLNSDPDNAPNIVELPFESIEDVKVWMVDNQLQRRNLSPAEVIHLMLLQSGELQKIAKRNLTRGGPGSEPCTNWYKVDVIADVAKKSGVGRTTVARAKKVFDKGTTELKDKMLAGDKSIHAAYQEVKEAEQEESATSFDVDSFDVVPTPSANAAAKKSLDTKVEEMDALIEKTKALYKKLFSALDNANTQKGVENFRFLESTLRRFDVSMKACDSVFSEFSSTWKRQRKG
jgi:transposase